MAHAASQADGPVSRPSRPVLDLDRLDAVVFDTDGVLTDTASVHAAAWKQLFDGYLEQRAARLGEPFRLLDQVRGVFGQDSVAEPKLAYLVYQAARCALQPDLAGEVPHLSCRPELGDEVVTGLTRRKGG